MREDPVRNLLRRRRDYKSDHRDIVKELNQSDEIFRSFDIHVASDKNIESKHSKSRLKSNIYGNADGSMKNKKNLIKKNMKGNKNNQLKNSSSQSNRSKSMDRRSRLGASVHIADNAWGASSSHQSWGTSSKPHHSFPFNQLGVDSAILDHESISQGAGQTGGQQTLDHINGQETFDGGQGWTISTFAEHSYVTTKIPTPTPAYKQHLNQSLRPNTSQSHHRTMEPLLPIDIQRPKSAPASDNHTLQMLKSATEIKGKFVRKRREELCRLRELTLIEKLEEREKVHNAMALERAQLVSKVLLRGLFAAKAAFIMKNIINIQNNQNKAISVIQRTARRYLRIGDITIMKSINSEAMIQRRRDVAVDLMKSLLSSTSFHNKLMRGIARVRHAARILQFHAKQWLVVRNARHFVLMKLWKILEPNQAREARRVFSIKQAKALKPNNANTLKWLVKGSEELAEIREKVLKMSNYGRALVNESKRAENHRKLMSGQSVNGERGQDEEVRLNFLVHNRTPDHIISHECHEFLFYERMKIFENVSAF